MLEWLTFRKSTTINIRHGIINEVPLSLYLRIFMTTVDSGLKVLYDVKDASWKPHEKATANMVLFDNHITAVVFDIVNQRFVSLYAAEADNNNRFELFKKRLSEVTPSVSKINLFLSIPKTMLIPAALYEKNTRKSFLENQHKIDPGDSIGDFPVKMIEAQMAFLYPESINPLEDKISWAPIDAAWLDVLSVIHKNSNENYFHFNISDGFISIAVFKDGSLQLYNTFETTTAEEVLYFVMFVSEQLHINPLKDPYYYSGFMLKTGATFNLLAGYIKFLKPEERPAGYSYAMPVLDVPGYMFFNAFCTPICEL